MVIESGSFVSVGPRGSISIKVDVYMRSPEVVEVWGRRNADEPGRVLIFDLENAYTSDGRLLPTTVSSLGSSVPARCRELWYLPKLQGADLIFHLLSRRPLCHPCARGLFLDSKALVDNLIEKRFFDFFAPKVIAESWYQFFRIGGGDQDIRGILTELASFNQKVFGAYGGGKLKSAYINRALRDGYFEIGYVDVEPSY